MLKLTGLRKSYNAYAYQIYRLYFIFIGPCIDTYEFLNVTNEMQLLENFIINIAVHVSGTLRPSSGAYGNCTCSYGAGMRYLVLI